MQLTLALERLAAELDTRGIATPALVIDLDAVDHNFRAMIERCGGPERWRPHVKTHKQSAIHEAAIGAGIRQFKCATITELDQLARAGRDAKAELSLLLAYAVGVPQLARINELARAYPEHRVDLLVDDPEQLQEYQEQLASPDAAQGLGIFIDVNVGMQRTGSLPGRWQAAIDGGLGPMGMSHLRGIHGYEGHIQWQEADAAEACYQQLAKLARSLINRFSPSHLTIVTSGTHAYHHALASEALAGLAGVACQVDHQVSPGTIVLSDLRSREAAQDIGLKQAAFVLSRIVCSDGNRATLDAGSKALNPDVVAPNCELLGYPEIVPQAPSEEHLPLRPRDPSEVKLPARGSLLWLVPKHVCTTVNLHRAAVLTRGETVLGMGEIESGHRGGLLPSAS